MLRPVGAVCCGAEPPPTWWRSPVSLSRPGWLSAGGRAPVRRLREHRAGDTACDPAPRRPAARQGSGPASIRLAGGEWLAASHQSGADLAGARRGLAARGPGLARRRRDADAPVVPRDGGQDAPSADATQAPIAGSSPAVEGDGAAATALRTPGAPQTGSSTWSRSVTAIAPRQVAPRAAPASRPAPTAPRAAPASRPAPTARAQRRRAGPRRPLRAQRRQAGPRRPLRSQHRPPGPRRPLRSQRRQAGPRRRPARSAGKQARPAGKHVARTTDGHASARRASVAQASHGDQHTLARASRRSPSTPRYGPARGSTRARSTARKTIEAVRRWLTAANRSRAARTRSPQPAAARGRGDHQLQPRARPRWRPPSWARRRASPAPALSALLVPKGDVLLAQEVLGLSERFRCGFLVPLETSVYGRALVGGEILVDDLGGARAGLPAGQDEGAWRTVMVAPLQSHRATLQAPWRSSSLSLGASRMRTRRRSARWRSTPP